MRAQILVAVFLLGAFAASAQDTPTPQPGQLKDPRAILAAAAPFYDFNDPALKPWHLKATYQLYDDKGNPAEQGIFEYWWASPKVYRVSWSRSSAKQTTWHTDDGKFAYVATGGPLDYFENQLLSNLFSPLPSADAIDPSKIHLIRNDVELGSTRFPCVSESTRKSVEPSDFRSMPTECFDPTLPILSFEVHFLGIVATNYDNVVKIQGKYLARAIAVVVGNKKLFTAAVDTIDSLDPASPAIVPSKDAIFEPDAVQAAEKAENGLLIKKELPEPPLTSEQQHLRSTALIEATIGVDGKVKDPHVIFSTSPSFSASTLKTISDWEFKPYRRNGTPIEVRIVIPMAIWPFL
jgi:hypothetical protein